MLDIVSFPAILKILHEILSEEMIPCTVILSVTGFGKTDIPFEKERDGLPVGIAVR